MFIRATKTTRNGKTYIQHRLVDSYRVGDKVRQQFILSLGTLSLPRERWGELAQAIEDKLNEKPPLFIAPEIALLAEKYSKEITEKRLREQQLVAQANTPQPEKIMPPPSPTYTEAYSNRTVGGEEVVLQAMEEYDFDNALDFLSEKERQYAKILLIGRALHPSSERETARWAREDSALPELLTMHTAIYDNALHRVAHKVWNNKEQVEDYCAKKAKEIFGLKESIILYDLTNTYFAGQLSASELAKHGRSKERRSDCPLVTLALCIDEDGFPKESEIYPGNIAESKTLAHIVRELKKTNKPLCSEKRTIIIDAGIATEENLALIRKEGFHYLAVSRKKSFEDNFWQQSKEKRVPLRSKKEVLKVKIARTPEELFLRVESQGKAKKAQAILARKMNKFEEGLENIVAKLPKKRTRKKQALIREQLGRLKERYRVGMLYDIVLEEAEGRVTKLTWKKKEQAIEKEKQGKTYVIRTSRTDLNEEEISQLHRSLTQVEGSFRSMKSHLGLRPNYHKKDEAIKAHLFITVLAYHFVASIQKKLHSKGYCHDWETIRTTLQGQIRISVKSKTGQQITTVRLITTPTEKQQEIHTILKTKPCRLIPTQVTYAPP